MGLQITTPPASEAITLAQAKAWARIDNAVEDADSTMLISAARDECEAFLRRPLLDTVYLWTLDGFPGYILPALRDPNFYNVARDYPDLILRLPIGGVSAIGNITYIDNDTQAQTTLDPSMYTFDPSEQPPRIAPAYQQAWPKALSQIASVKVAFTAGYGSTPDKIPPGVLRALRVVFCDMWENRSETIASQGYILPRGAEWSMWPHRVFPLRKG